MIIIFCPQLKYSILYNVIFIIKSWYVSKAIKTHLFYATIIKRHKTLDSCFKFFSRYDKIWFYR